MLIVDSGCDQCIVNKSRYIVNHFIGITFDVDNVLTDMKSSQPLEVANKGITYVNSTTGHTKYTKILLELKHCLLNLNTGQTESCRSHIKLGLIV